MYALHDNGRKLFTSPQDCTPMQRFVYLMAKDYHTEDVDNSTPTNPGSSPGGFDKAQEFNQAAPQF